MDTAQQNAQQQFYAAARAAATAIWDAYHECLSLQTQWNSLNYGATLEPGDGVHLGLTGTHVGSVVFDTTNAIKALIDAGHGTNLATLL